MLLLKQMLRAELFRVCPFDEASITGFRRQGPPSVELRVLQSRSAALSFSHFLGSAISQPSARFVRIEDACAQYQTPGDN